MVVFGNGAKSKVEVSLLVSDETRQQIDVGSVHVVSTLPCFLPFDFARSSHSIVDGRNISFDLGSTRWADR